MADVMLTAVDRYVLLY